MNMRRLITLNTGIASLALLSLTSMLQGADTVNTSTHEEHDFNNNSLWPFYQHTTSGDNYAKAISNQHVKVVWHEDQYNGTRNRRGAEFHARDAKGTEDTMTGFKIYIPAGSSTNYGRGSTQFPENKNNIIWQNFQEGDCWSWAAIMSIRNNDLWISHRNYCGAATESKIYTDLPRNSWITVQIHTRASKNSTGHMHIYVNGSRKYLKTGINFGFGDWSGDSLSTTNKQRIKFGMYCYDTAGYVNNEVRSLYFDNCSVYIGTNDPWGTTDPN